MTNSNPSNNDNIADHSPIPGGVDSPSAPPPTTNTAATNADYDFASILPAGHGLTPEQISAQAELFKSAAISQEIAKKIVDDKFTAVQDAIKSGTDAQIEKAKADWVAATNALKEKSAEKFGDKLAEVQGYIPKALNKFLAKDEADQFTQFLEESGLHNDPRVLSFFSAVGKSVSEDTPSTGLGPDTKPKTTTANLFPNSNMNP
jgi:hypothetical protein